MKKENWYRYSFIFLLGVVFGFKLSGTCDCMCDVEYKINTPTLERVYPEGGE